MNLLGIDFGLKRVGVALSETGIAHPLATFSTASAPARIQKLVSKHQIHRIIIGEADPKIKTHLDKLISSLKSTQTEIVLFDETLSSQDASLAMFHTSASRRQRLNHQVSAAIILQNYIDSRLASQ